MKIYHVITEFDIANGSIEFAGKTLPISHCQAGDTISYDDAIKVEENTND